MSGQHRVSTADPVPFLAEGVARTFDCSRRTEAEEWRASTDFLPIVHERNSKVSGDDFFNRPELQPLREAYAAGLFAWILGEQHKVRVKVDKDRFPDFDCFLIWSAARASPGGPIPGRRVGCRRCTLGRCGVVYYQRGVRQSGGRNERCFSAEWPPFQRHFLSSFQS